VKSLYNTYEHTCTRPRSFLAHICVLGYVSINCSSSDEEIIDADIKRTTVELAGVNSTDVFIGDDAASVCEPVSSRRLGAFSAPISDGRAGGAVSAVDPALGASILSAASIAMDLGEPKGNPRWLSRHLQDSPAAIIFSLAVVQLAQGM
jgi:hypothetical protein